MASTLASQFLRSSFASQVAASMNPYAKGFSSSIGPALGGGGVQTSAPVARGGERATSSPEGDSGPLGLPMPVVIGGGVALAAVVGLVIYKVRKKK